MSVDNRYTSRYAKEYDKDRDFTGSVTFSGNTMTAGAGFTGGAGTVCATSVQRNGDIVTTQFLIDLTDLYSSTTDLDIIGVGTEPAYFGAIDAAVNGTVIGGSIRCLETPAGGITDIDIYSATEGTGVFDGGIAALTETELHTNGGAWSAAPETEVAFSAAFPADGQYLYLTGGAAGTAAKYTAGQFLITLIGHI